MNSEFSKERMSIQWLNKLCKPEQSKYIKRQMNKRV